jgi:hypothetical protein
MNSAVVAGRIRDIVNDTKEFLNMTAASDSPLAWYALDRQEDVTGISGTGVIAYVLVLEHGVLVLWDAGWQTVSWYPDMETMLDIHGHDGRTLTVAIDKIGRPMKLLHDRIGDVLDTIGDLAIGLIGSIAELKIAEKKAARVAAGAGDDS